ncbi:MAG: AI-2E family transporter [Pseudonocardiales bacterium]
MPGPDQDPTAAADRAENAEHRAEAAQLGAEKAEHAAEVAEHGAESAESGAEEAERGAEQAETGAQTAVERALELLPDDDPLLDPNIHEFAAGADEEHPYGTTGKPFGDKSPFRTAFAAALGVLLALVLAYSVIQVRSVIVLVVISAFLAIGLNPAVEMLQRRGLKRGLAAALVMSAVLLFFGGFVAAAVPPLVRQASQLRDQLPDKLTELRQNNDTFKQLDRKYHFQEKVTSIIKQQSSTAPAKVAAIAKGVLVAIGKTLTVLILTLYFISSYDRIKRGALRLVPRSRRPRVALLADEILSRVGGYVLGNLATSVVAGVAAGIWFMALGVPYAFALAMFVAIFDLIPLVGATIAAVACVIVAFFVSAPVGIATLVFFIAYQQFENYVLVPRVMKATVDVSPLATVLSALVGATLLGPLGALLAVPTAAAISLIGSEVITPRQDAL